MKPFFKFILFALIPFLAVNSPPNLQAKQDTSKARLILFVDINKTIMPSDAVQGEGTDHTLMSILAESKDYETNWQFYDPSFQDSTPITFKAYIDQKHKGKDKKEIRAEYGKFISFLKGENPKERKHPKALAVERRYQLLKGKASGMRDGVVSSFFSLLEYLKSNKLHYAIVLRTFGTDLNATMKSLSQNAGLKNLGLSGLDNNGVLRPGKMNANNEGYEFNSRGELVLNMDKVIANGPKEILNAIPNESGILLGWQDNFDRWKASGWKDGKLFPFVNTPKLITMFFDDNANEPEKQIVEALDLKGKRRSREQLMNLGHLVAVDTIQTLENDNYFIEKVENVLRTRKGKNKDYQEKAASSIEKVMARKKEETLKQQENVVNTVQASVTNKMPVPDTKEVKTSEQKGDVDGATNKIKETMEKLNKLGGH